MPLYQPSALELSLIAVDKASELANSVISNSISTRSAQDKPIDGCLPDVSVEGAQRRTAKGQEILHLLGNIDDEALPHEYALTAKLARFFAQAWSKDADRYWLAVDVMGRSEEHTSELQSLMRISYAVFCLKKNKKKH